jgi:hypothetical protein
VLVSAVGFGVRGSGGGAERVQGHDACLQRRGSMSRTRVPMTRWNSAASSGSSGAMKAHGLRRFEARERFARRRSGGLKARLPILAAAVSAFGDVQRDADESALHLVSERRASSAEHADERAKGDERARARRDRFRATWRTSCPRVTRTLGSAPASRRPGPGCERATASEHDGILKVPRRAASSPWFPSHREHSPQCESTARRAPSRAPIPNP